MEYPVYAAYRDSGVEWLGKVPEHWAVRRLKFTSDIIDCKNRTPEYFDDGEYLVVRTSNVRNQKLICDGAFFTDEKNYITWTRRGVPPKGSILFTREAPAGEICRVPDDVSLCLGQRMMNFIPFNEKYTDFLFAFLASANLTNFIAIEAKGSTVTHLRVEQVYNIPVLLPPEAEQAQIVRYLIPKTQQIDQLISKKQTLIDKLNEQRIALITQAVTKGLNPDVEMKDSGIEWLGEVPEHWDLLRLRFLGTCQNGISIGGEHFGQGCPFVSYGDVYHHRELGKEVKGLVESTEADRKVFSVKSGDVFFTRTSESIEEIAMSSVCMQDIENAVFAGFLIRFRPDENGLVKEFSKFYFQNALLRAFFVKEMNLVTRASLNQNLLQNLPVLLPSEDEQKDIASYLENETQRFDHMAKLNQQTITKLKEYRTALITAAVTGKIDVRNWQSQQEIA